MGGGMIQESNYDELCGTAQRKKHKMGSIDWKAFWGEI